MSEILILRSCQKAGFTSGGFRWPLEVGSEVEAPDWDPRPIPGGGLHGLPWGVGDSRSLMYEREPDAVWLVFRADSADIVCGGELDGGACKARRGTIVYVGDRDGAVAYLLAHGAAGRAVVYAHVTVGDEQEAVVGDRGVATAGKRGTAFSGDWSLARAGEEGSAKAGFYSIASSGTFGRSEVEYGGIASAGSGGTAIAGDRGTALSIVEGKSIAGDYGLAQADTRGFAVSGNYGTAIAGDDGAAIAGDHGIAIVGLGGIAQAGEGGTLVIEYEGGGKRTAHVSARGGLMPGRAYRLDSRGRFEPAAPSWANEFLFPASLRPHLGTAQWVQPTPART